MFSLKRTFQKTFLIPKFVIDTINYYSDLVSYNSGIHYSLNCTPLGEITITYNSVDYEFYSVIITQVILASWLVLAYDLLEDRRTIEVIIAEFLPLCFKMAEVLKI